jgi:hypothetical protein
MRQGVPFIAPRQLGAVGNKSGRPSLPSVSWRTGQSGAHRTLSGARFISIHGAVDRCRPLEIWKPMAHRTVRCTPDSPVPPSDRWLSHVSRADSAADRWLGPTVGSPDSPVHTGQSGAPFRPLAQPRVSRRFRGRPLARADRWLTGQSGAHRTVR